jgi:hypothetical protein
VKPPERHLRRPHPLLDQVGLGALELCLDALLVLRGALLGARDEVTVFVLFCFVFVSEG